MRVVAGLEHKFPFDAPSWSTHETCFSFTSSSRRYCVDCTDSHQCFRLGPLPSQLNSFAQHRRHAASTRDFRPVVRIVHVVCDLLGCQIDRPERSTRPSHLFRPDPEFRLENLTAVLVVNKIYDSNLTLLYATLSCKLVVIRDLKAQDFGFAADRDVLSPVMVVRLIRSFCRLIHPLTVLR